MGWVEILGISSSSSSSEREAAEGEGEEYGPELP